MTRIEIEVLEDGTISVTTGDIEDTQHISADDLLNTIAEMAGGKRVVKRRENPFFKNKAVLRGGKIVKIGH